MLSMNQADTKFLAQFIANETKDLRERIEKLEAELAKKRKAKHEQA